MGRKEEQLRSIAQENGLQFDSRTCTAFGNKNGYEIYLDLASFNGTALIMLNVSVSKGTEPPDRKELESIVKQHKVLGGCTVHGYKAAYQLRTTVAAKKSAELTREAIEIVTQFLREHMYRDCCQTCGQAKPISVCSVSGVTQQMCDDCFLKVSSAVDRAHQEETQKTESVFGGIIGALIGSLIGVAAIVLLGQLGYVAALSGLVMGVCTLKGYELLGRRLSTRGLIISCVIMLAMVYLGNQLDWAFTVMRATSMDFVLSFRAIPMLISQGVIEVSNYLINLGLVYVFAVLGAVPTVRSAIVNQKEKHITAKLQNS